MTSNCPESWEDDWENIEVPDLQVSIENKQRELKLLEERKLMEEADLALAEELFVEQTKKCNGDIALLEPIKFFKEKPKQLQFEQEKRRQELRERQKQQSHQQREKKKQAKHIRETFGEAELDEYDEMYGDLEDKY